jgi:hypothetical protein
MITEAAEATLAAIRKITEAPVRTSTRTYYCPHENGS